MSLELTETVMVRFDDDQLKKAIEIRISKVFGALNMANALAGYQSTEWKLIRSFSAAQLFAEAESRGIALETLKGAVEENPISECRAYSDWLKSRER